MDLLEKACSVVSETLHRYMVPDPARLIAIGDYGRVKNGMLIKRGNLQTWFDAKKIVLPDDIRVRGEVSSTVENTVLASNGVRSTTAVLSGDVSVSWGDAKVGIKLAFSKENQTYFHCPGLRFTGMRDMGVIGDTLVTCAKRDDHDPQFWEDDYCIVTGVYNVQSCVQVFSENTTAEVGFTAKGAATVQELYKVGVELGFTTQATSGKVMQRSYHSASAVPVFYELHKVHWDVFGNKWWDVVEKANPR